MSRHGYLGFGTVLLGLVLATSADAGTIGVNFEGGGNGVGAISLAPTDSAGVIPQTNYNNVSGGTGTAIPLNDGSGAATSALLTFSGGGTYSVGQASPVGGDQELNDGFVFADTTINVTNIPYAAYDVYVYELNDASGRPEQTYINNDPTTSVFGSAASALDPDHVSGAANTYLYLQSVGAMSSPTPNGDYAEFTGLTGSSLTIFDTATNNGYVNGFQIVQIPVPEPSSLALLGCGVVGLLFAAGRRRDR